MINDDGFDNLLNFMSSIPAVKAGIAKGYENDNWWIKFSIDIHHKLAWNVVQEIGHVVNYLSVEERLPTIFYPVSPPPYMNGGPEFFLSWVIESTKPSFTPDNLKEWLQGRLPDPVSDLNEWNTEDE